MRINTDHSTPGILLICRVLLWACAFALAVAAPPARGATDAANATEIQSHLPAKLTLKQASIKQTAAALHEAVLQHHDDAPDLLRVAIVAKTPQRGDGGLSCEDLRRLAQAACTAASDRTSQLVDLANSLCPDCADSLQDLLTDGGDTLGAGGGDGFGFGVGFGPGLPGSPQFAVTGATGSSGQGLPPASPPPVTPAGND